MALTSCQQTFLRRAARVDGYDERLALYRQSGCQHADSKGAGNAMTALFRNPEAERFLEAEQANRDTQLAIELEALDTDKAATRKREEQVRQLALLGIAEGILAERKAIRETPERSKSSLAALCKLVPLSESGGKPLEEMTPAELVATARRMGLPVPEKPMVVPETPAPVPVAAEAPKPKPPPPLKPHDIHFSGPENGRA